MNIPQELAWLVFALWAVAPFAACWWTNRLASQAHRVDQSLVNSMREMARESVQTCMSAANTTAEAAKGVTHAILPITEVIDAIASFKLEASPLKHVERMASLVPAQFVPQGDMGGGFESGGHSHRAAAPEMNRPPGNGNGRVILPSEM